MRKKKTEKKRKNGGEEARELPMKGKSFFHPFDYLSPSEGKLDGPSLTQHNNVEGVELLAYKFWSLCQFL